MTVDKLKNLTLLITDGKHGDCENADNSGFYFVSCKDIHDGIINYTDARQITEQDFVETHRRTQLQPNDILVTNSGTIGRMALVKDVPETIRTTFQKSVAIVKPDTSKIIPAYLYYCLLNRVTDFVNNSNGSAQKNLLLGTMRDFTIQYYEQKTKQETVVSIIKPFDDLIETNQRQIKLLEEAAQRLYKEWFVDLRFPGHENVPVVDGVPEGWKNTTMATVCQAVGGGTPSTARKEYYENGTIPWVTPTDLTKMGSWILLDTEKKITTEGLANSATKMLPPYTILMTSRASIGYIAICEKEVCTNQGFISCIPYIDNIRYYLMFNLLNRVEEIKSKATGSTFLEIAKRTFRELQIIEPSESVLILFNTMISSLLDKMRILRKQIEALDTTRNSLLPKLMSGEIAV